VPENIHAPPMQGFILKSPSPTTRKFCFSFKLSLINDFFFMKPPSPLEFPLTFKGPWQWPFNFTPKAIVVLLNVPSTSSQYFLNVILMLLISETDNFIRNGQIRLLCFCFAYFVVCGKENHPTSIKKCCSPIRLHRGM